MKIVLIDPPPKHRIEQHDVRGWPHLGLAYIAAYLRSKGISCVPVDAKYQRLGLDEVMARVLSASPDIVGITAMTHEIKQANEVAERVKKALPSATTVIGGAHATALPTRTLAEFPAFDVAVSGEGEITLLELANALEHGGSLAEVRGIAYRTGNGIHQNDTREFIQDLDALPFPAWDLYPRSERYPILTARGCPFGCNFCMRVMGNRVRKRSPESVIAELKDCVSTYSPGLIHFMDETLTLDRAHLDRLLDLMLEAGLQKKIRWDAQTRADLGDYELFRKMRFAGCEWLGIGVESGNESVLKASGKRITLNKAASAVGAAKRAGLKTDGYFIIGHPYETPKTAQDTINFAARLNPTRVTIGIMVPYPGTEIYEMATTGKGGYKLLSTDWDDFNKNIGDSLELDTLSRRQLERLQALGYLKFYLYNLRFLAAAQYLFHQRKLAVAIIRKLLGGGKAGGAAKQA